MIKKGIWIFQKFNSAEGVMFTASFAYSLLLALAPILTIFVITFQVTLDLNSITDFLVQYIPDEFVIPFVNYLKNQSFSGLLSLIMLLLASIYIASKSVYSFLLISSKEDEVEYEPFFLRILSILLFVLMILFVIFLLILCQKIFRFRYLGSFLSLLLCFVLFYRLLSFRQYPLYTYLSGGIFSTVALTVLGKCFFFVIDHFTLYETKYGPLSSLVILLLSCYIISCIVYLGYCIIHVLIEDPQKVPLTRQAHSFYNIFNSWFKRR